MGTLKVDKLTASWIDSRCHRAFKKGVPLNDVNVFEGLSYEFQAGKLYAIIGEVGSGKSSLLYACLSELIIKSGSIELNGGVSYVP